MRTAIALVVATLTGAILVACGSHAARSQSLHATTSAAGAVHAAAARGARRPVVTDGWAGDGIVSAPGGPDLVDAYGRRLQLHGADLAPKCGGGAVPQPTPGTPCVGPDVGPQPAYLVTPTATDPQRRFTEQDAATLQRLGLNTIRLGIVWEGMEPGPRGARPDDPIYCAPHRAGTPYPTLRGAQDPYDARTVQTYLGHVDTIVDMLAAHGIRTIIDMQQDAFGSAFSNVHTTHPWQGEGAPPWATCTDHAPFVAPGTWGLAARQPAEVAADHSFYANDVRGDLQGQFVRVWQAVATHFRGNANVLGYELINEPADFTHTRFDAELQCDYGGPVHEPRSCAASGAQALPDGWIGAIRAADPDHTIFYEPPIYNQASLHEEIGISEPLRFANLAFAFHLYHSRSYFGDVFAPELAHTRTLQPGGPAEIMDEFGSTPQYVGAGLDADEADALHISWTYWAALALDDPSGNAGEQLLQTDGQAGPGKAQALGIPYAMATAGQPGATHWLAGTRTFSYAYRPDARITAPTEIQTPRETYPRGYRVTARGARVVSAPGSPILELAARPGARRVSVTVTP